MIIYTLNYGYFRACAPHLSLRSWKLLKVLAYVSNTNRSTPSRVTYLPPPPDPPPPSSSSSRVHKNESIKRNVMAKRLRISALNQISLLETVYFSKNKQNMKRHGSKSWRPKCDWFCLHVASTPHYATWKCSRWIVACWCEKRKRPSRFSNFKIEDCVRSQTGLRCSIDKLEKVKQICFHVESSFIYNKARIVWRLCDTAPWKRQ